MTSNEEIGQQRVANCVTYFVASPKPLNMGGQLAASTIVSVRAIPLTVCMSEPFEIATGAQSQVENVLIAVRLADKTVGYGECAPARIVNRETQAGALKAAAPICSELVGRDAARFAVLSHWLKERLPIQASVRAGFEMALLDAWARRRRLPLWIYFGGASDRVRTDVTIPIMPPEAAAKAARRILRRGISTIKIKVGKDFDADVRRVEAVAKAAPRASLIVDANCGFDPRVALEFLRDLRRIGVRPILFEQPVSRLDWEGLARVSREGGVLVAADETVSSIADAWRMARRRCADVVNIKLMKFGLAEAWEVARIARAAGLGLMIGGMVESHLAMGCAAHLAAGFGGFQFVDLDTPLWFAVDPMRGLKLAHGGLYDLRPVEAGIGVRPRADILGPKP